METFAALELPAVDQHLADGYIRPAVPPGEADTHDLSSAQANPSGALDLQKEYVDRARQVEDRLRTIAQCASFDFRAVPVWHETAVLHPPSDAPAGEVGREGAQIDLNQVGRTREKRGLHSRIGLPGAFHLRLEVAGQKAIGAPIVADDIRLELPLQKRSRGGLIAFGHRSSRRAHTRPADGQIHTGGDHSALRLSGRERIRVLAALQQRGHCLGHPIRLPTRQVAERDRGKAQLIGPGTGAAASGPAIRQATLVNVCRFRRRLRCLRRVSPGSHRRCQVRLVNRMSNAH